MKLELARAKAGYTSNVFDPSDVASTDAFCDNCDRGCDEISNSSPLRTRNIFHNRSYANPSGLGAPSPRTCFGDALTALFLPAGGRLYIDGLNDRIVVLANRRRGGSRSRLRSQGTHPQRKPAANQGHSLSNFKDCKEVEDVTGAQGSTGLPQHYVDLPIRSAISSVEWFVKSFANVNTILSATVVCITSRNCPSVCGSATRTNFSNSPACFIL